MPHKQKHRGQHPQDATLFAPKWHDTLRTAVDDFCLLLTKGYADNATLKFVGDRYSLKTRQRMAIRRSSCSDASLEKRRFQQTVEEALAGQTVYIDGYNVLIITESALSGGVVMVGRDGCYRDLASVHGTYKRVEETFTAIELIGRALAALKVGKAVWYLDTPVSNSGRLKGFLHEIATQHHWNWEVHLAYNPDKELIKHQSIIASSDGMVIENSEKWFNLSGYIIDEYVKDACVIRF